MGKIIMVTGGKCCGKSAFAEDMAGQFGDNVLYIATLVPNEADEETCYRINSRQEFRPETWDTLEAYDGIGDHIENFGAGYDAIILNRISVMVTNLMLDYQLNWADAGIEALKRIEKEIVNKVKDVLVSAQAVPAPVIVVTNELGLGTRPEDRFTKIRRDITGKINMKVASISDEAYLVVSGIPVKIK